MDSNESNKQYIDESKRCLNCPTPRCKQACPIGNDIPTFLQYVRDGEYDKAVEVIGHPFGEICGYVCAHEQQCHGGCVLCKKGQAVQMGAVERAVFAERFYSVERQTDQLNGRKFAVIGGGVSGITFAVKAYEQGADVTIYEKDELLSTVKLIPDFRLPRETIARVEREIDGKFTVIKKQVCANELAKLSREFDIVYLATGASILYNLGVDGENLATPYDVFLKKSDHSGNVVVIGGGNTAMDCARLAKRCGCDVTVAYRRTREDMPAFAKEIVDAEREGVKFVYNVAPVCVSPKDGKLLLVVAKTVSEGRGKLTVTEDTTIIECDTVVSALGSGFDKSIYNSFAISDDARHPLPNVYVGGDAVGGKIVAKAVADALQTFKLISENTTK